MGPRTTNTCSWNSSRLPQGSLPATAPAGTVGHILSERGRGLRAGVGHAQFSLPALACGAGFYQLRAAELKHGRVAGAHSGLPPLMVSKLTRSLSLKFHPGGGLVHLLIELFRDVGVAVLFEGTFLVRQWLALG